MFPRKPASRPRKHVRHLGWRVSELSWNVSNYHWHGFRGRSPSLFLHAKIFRTPLRTSVAICPTTVAVGVARPLISALGTTIRLLISLTPLSQGLLMKTRTKPRPFREWAGEVVWSVVLAVMQRKKFHVSGISRRAPEMTLLQTTPLAMQSFVFWGT